MKRLSKMFALGSILFVFAAPARAELVVRLSPLSYSPGSGGLVGYAAGLGWLKTAADNSYQWSVLEADLANTYSGGDGDLLLTSTYLFAGKPAGIFWLGLRGGAALRLGAGDPEILGAGAFRFTPADHKTYYEADVGASSTGDVFLQLTLALAMF